MAERVMGLHTALLDRIMALRKQKDAARTLQDWSAADALDERLNEAIKQYFVAACRHKAAERDAAGLPVEEWMRNPLARTDDDHAR